MHLQAMSYFYGLITVKFDEGQEEHAHIGTLQALYSEGVIQKVLQLPILSPQYTWTRKITFALQHWCAFHLIECNRRNLNHAARCISLLSTDCLANVKKQVARRHKLALIAKNRKDADLIEKLPPVPKLKAAVRKAMIDLAVLHSVYAGQTSMPEPACMAALASVTGVIFCGGFGGRCGEWECMPLEHVKQQLSAGKNFLVCPHHKTAHKYGELGKYLSPGVKDRVRR